MPIPEEFQPTDFADDFFESNERELQRQERMRLVQRRDHRSQLQQRMSEKETCVACGGTWFQEITLNQYRPGTYSSAPGGGLEIVSAMPMTTLRCLCGMPVAPNIGGALHGGRTPNENLASFDGSVNAALNYLTEKPGQDAQRIAENVVSQTVSVFASAEEVKAAATRLDTVATKLDELALAIGYSQPVPEEAPVEAPASEPEAEPVVAAPAPKGKKK